MIPEHPDTDSSAPDVPESRRFGLAAGLMAGAVLALCCAAVLLGCAAAVPAVVGAGESAPEPVGWARWLVLPVAVLAIASLALIGQRTAWLWARLLVSGGTVVLLTVSGWLVWRGLPVPGPEFGLGPRLAWILVGCGLGVVAGLVYAAGAYLARRAGGTGPGRRPTAVAAAVVAVVLAVAGVAGVGVANDWTAAQNVDVARADGPLTGQRASDFDGSTRWRTTTTAAGDATVATRGGIVVAAGSGVYAIDPTTGRTRWHYADWRKTVHRSPLLSDNRPPVASPDGRYVAVIGHQDTGPNPLGEERPSRSDVYVFDAVSGRLLDRFDAHDRRPEYVDGRIVVLDDGRETPRGVTAYRHDGSRLWEFTRTGRCRLAGMTVNRGMPGAVTGIGDNVLIAHNCGGRVKVSARDAATGEERWSWTHDGYISPNGIIVPDAGRPGAGTVVLDLPRVDPHGKRPKPAANVHTVTALDVETGQPRWSRGRVRVGRAPVEAEWRHSHAGVYTAGTLVLAGWRDDDQPVELVGVNPANGKERWRRRVDIGHTFLGDFGALSNVLGVAAGKVVFAGASSKLDGPDRVRLTVVDAKTGRTVRSTLLSRRFKDLTKVNVAGVVGDVVVLWAPYRHYLFGLG